MYIETNRACRVNEHHMNPCVSIPYKVGWRHTLKQLVCQSSNKRKECVKRLKNAAAVDIELQ